MSRRNLRHNGAPGPAESRQKALAEFRPLCGLSCRSQSDIVAAEEMVKRALSAQKQALGLRQKNKLDKLRRIKAAAAELFSKKGFDVATTRDIARRAHVGKGTVFLYAPDKRALVFLLYDEELQRIRAGALKRIKPNAPLSEQLVALLSVFYEEFSKNVPLSRIMLKELLFYQGPHEKDHRPHGLRIIFDIAELVEKAQRNDTIGCKEDSFLIANYIYNIHQGALRAWIWDDKPCVAEGITHLRRLLALVFEGLNAGPLEQQDRKPKLVV